MTPSERQLVFQDSGDARFPYQATVDGKVWRVRVNEFPNAPSLYSLIVDGKVVEELMSWPIAWQRPDAEDAHERAEYEREIDHTERTRGVPPSKLVK